MGMNAEGGSQNFKFGTRPSESSLHEHLVPIRSHRRPRRRFFLRAESLFNVQTEVEQRGLTEYGWEILHEAIARRSVSLVAARALCRRWALHLGRARGSALAQTTTRYDSPNRRVGSWRKPTHHRHAFANLDGLPRCDNLFARRESASNRRVRTNRTLRGHEGLSAVPRQFSQTSPRRRRVRRLRDD